MRAQGGQCWAAVVEGITLCGHGIVVVDQSSSNGGRSRCWFVLRDPGVVPVHLRVAVNIWVLTVQTRAICIVCVCHPATCVAIKVHGAVGGSIPEIDRIVVVRKTRGRQRCCLLIQQIFCIERFGGRQQGVVLGYQRVAGGQRGGRINNGCCGQRTIGIGQRLVAGGVGQLVTGALLRQSLVIVVQRRLDAGCKRRAQAVLGVDGRHDRLFVRVQDEVATAVLGRHLALGIASRQTGDAARSAGQRTAIQVVGQDRLQRVIYHAVDVGCQGRSSAQLRIVQRDCVGCWGGYRGVSSLGSCL